MGRLQEKDLSVLLERAISVARKWRWVGLALGFLDSVLDEIESTDKDPKECFRKMLSRWLKQAPPNHDYPSSRTLTKALRSKMVEEERLALDLEQYFSETGTTDPETVESPPTANAATSSLLHTDTQHTVMVESPPTPKPRAPVYTYERNLHLYAIYVWNKDPRTSLVERYLELTESVKEALEKKGVTAEEILDALEARNVAEGKAYMESALKQAAAIQRAADIQELLAAVTSHLTFLDYKPLEHLITEFDLKEVEEELERYKKDLQQFLLLMMEAPPDTDPPPRKKRRVGPDPEVRREQGTTT